MNFLRIKKKKKKIQCLSTKLDWLATKDGHWLASNHFVRQICKEAVHFCLINRFSAGGRAEFWLKDSRGEQM
jgi:hypothetical protein